MIFIDSHSHINFPELLKDLPGILDRMQKNQVAATICISVDLAYFPQILQLAEQHASIYASAGVHPDYQDTFEPSVQDLLDCAQHPRVLGIGETGLDYYRLPKDDLDWQRERFRVHIRAARSCQKPLIVHTRAAGEDTLRILQEEKAGVEEGGPAGVIHCFTESRAFAEQAIAMGFYISFSGIVTFKNARELQEIARWVPLDRILIETDSPYLAPVPFRGKQNEPAFVKHVAEFLAELKGISIDEVAKHTTDNFVQLFKLPNSEFVE